MKKYLYFFLILLYSNYATSQNITEKSLVGRWKVTKILKQSNNPNFKELVKSFGAATFEFKENGIFKLTTSINTKLFVMVTDMTNNSKWKLNKNNFVIYVGDEKNGYSILKIIVAEVNKKLIFHMSETELDLEVEKE